MKKLNFLSLLFAIDISSVCFIQKSQAILIQSFNNAQHAEVIQPSWTRVKANFNKEKFLIDCDKEHKTNYAQSINKSGPNYDLTLIEKCWNALLKLKDKYNEENDFQNKTFTYQSMAKLLLTYDIFPNFCKIPQEKRDFIIDLIDHIGRTITPQLAPEKHRKLKRWFHIYEGMLFLKYANEFALPERRSRHITNAFYEFSEAVNLKTTKTTYLLAAETILDYGHTPNEMTREEAENLAYSYIELAEEKVERSTQRRNNVRRPKEKLTTVEVHAQPTYMGQLNNQNIYPTTQNIANNQNQLLPNNLMVIQDELENYDFAQLIIPQRQHIDDLIIRNNSINKTGELQEIYFIDGHSFRRQNVSGDRLRCFFNAIGLNPEGQAAQLAFFANDPILRWMIANEIVSAAENPNQIPEQVKEAINYELYRTQRTQLNELGLERNNLLSEQNPNPAMQDQALLPAKYQNLDQQGEQILEQLRTRSLSLDAYNAFIKHHIDNEEMMVMLPDMQHNGNFNFTSIDAIGYINNIGIKIYTPIANGELRLIHEYIPINATEIAYIYYQPDHFQALLPVEENIDANDPIIPEEQPEEQVDIESENNHPIIPEEQIDIETENSSDFEIPSSKELKKLYPTIKTFTEGKYDENIVRKILYMKQYLNINAKEIHEFLNIDARRISQILVAHDIRSKIDISNDIKEKIFQAYLECYKNIKNQKITRDMFSKSLSTLFEKQKIGKTDSKKIKNIIRGLHDNQIKNNNIEKNYY